MFFISENVKIYILNEVFHVILSGRVVFQVPDWLHHLLMGTRILFKNTLEMYTDYYIHCKLEQLFQEHRLVSLITLLRGLYSRVCFMFCVLLTISVRSKRGRSLVFIWFISFSTMRK